MSNPHRFRRALPPEFGVVPLDYVHVDAVCSAISGYRHPDVIPEALLNDLFRKPPVREIGNPYRFRRKTCCK